jgi:hypothetical protein
MAGGRLREEGEIQQAVRFRGFTETSWSRLRLHCLVRKPRVTLSEEVGNFLLALLDRFDKELPPHRLLKKAEKLELEV